MQIYSLSALSVRNPTGVPWSKNQRGWPMLSCFSGVWLCDLMDCSPPGSSIHGISQARILERTAVSFPSDLPDPGSNLCLYVSCIGMWVLYHQRLLGRVQSLIVVRQLSNSFVFVSWGSSSSQSLLGSAPISLFVVAFFIFEASNGKSRLTLTVPAASPISSLEPSQEMCSKDSSDSVGTT